MVDRDPGENHAHEDIYMAIRDAFDAARRQLQDYVRLGRGGREASRRAGRGAMKAIVIISAAIAVATVAACRTTEPVNPYDGRNLYLGYCASCHGPTGAGDGPLAPALVYRMEDLRTLEQRRGVFPQDWLEELIDGRTLRAAHGSRDMPVWGWQFRAVEDSDAEVMARIDALIDYLRSIQLEETP